MLMNILSAVAEVSTTLQKQDIGISFTNVALSNLKDRRKWAKKCVHNIRKKKDKDGTTKKVLYIGHKIDLGKWLKSELPYQDEIFYHGVSLQAT